MVKKNQEKIKEKNSGPICAVCMETTARAQIGCSHKFCMKCITRWTKRNETCPLCRGRINEIKYGKRVKLVEPKHRPPIRTHSESSNVRIRIAWKPLIFIGFPYFNYFVPNPTLMQPVMF